MNYLQIVNSVMRRMRENEVSSVNEGAYSKLIGELVNEAKREVEDAYNWVQLKSTMLINTTPGVFTYTMVGSGHRFRILHAYNNTDDVEMKIAPSNWLTKQFLTNGGVQTGSPIYYDVNGSSNGDSNIDIWPSPDKSYDLTVDMVVPQASLSLDTDTLLIDYWPVLLGTYAKAISERGDDSGMQFGEAMINYNKALGDLIAIDAAKTPHMNIWEVV